MTDNFNNKISVLLPLHRIDNFIKKSVISILNQTHNNIELIIISNGPNAPTKDYINEITQFDTRVFYYHTDITDLSFALNLGIHYSTSDFIARMDGDDIAHEMRLKTQLNFLFANDLDACGSDVSLIDEFDNLIGKFNYPYGKKIYLTKFFSNPFCHPTLLIKKNVILNIGAYAGLKHTEDYNLILRLINMKYKFDNISLQLLSYRIHNSHGRKRKITYAEAAGYQFIDCLISFKFYSLLGMIFWTIKMIILGKK